MPRVVPLPRGHGPSEMKKNEAGKERQTFNITKKLMTGGWGEEEGWMVGNWASLVAECMPYIDW